MEKLGAVVLVQVDHDLCVGLRVEPVAPRFQFLPEFRVVENFSVKDDPNGPVLVVNWLISASKIDDAQPGMGQPCNAIPVNAGCIRAPVAQQTDHTTEKTFLRCRSSEVYDASDAAHNTTSRKYDFSITRSLPSYPIGEGRREANPL